MLVVMLVLMVATASAAVSVGTVQSEIQAAGHDRLALQTGYVSEAAMMSTITWIDMLGESGQWLQTWESWQTTRPTMSFYAEPAIQNGTAARTTMKQQDVLETNDLEVSPLNEAVDPPSSGSGGSGGTGGTGGTGGASGAGSGGSGGGGSEVDTVGSFGPRQKYGIPAEGYVVDINDCMLAPAAAVPGSPVGGGPGSLRVRQFYCTLTARGRLFSYDFENTPANQTTREDHERRWTFGTNTTYDQPMYGASHDSRAMIVTPQMIVPDE
jgi:hypothetical protein